MSLPTGETDVAVMRGCMDYHTFESDRVQVRNLLGAVTWKSIAAAPEPANSSQPVPAITDSHSTMDSDHIFEWRQHAGGASMDSSSSR
jgi:hypothetical protein